MSQILTVEQAAEKLQLAPYTIRKYLREGKIPGHKVGKVWRMVEADLIAAVHGLAATERPEWEYLARGEKEEQADSVMGSLADMPFSSEDFIREKQAEIEREERHWQEHWAGAVNEPRAPYAEQTSARQRLRRAEARGRPKPARPSKRVSAMGICSDLPISSEDYSRRKQEEIAFEERRRRERVE